MKRSPFFRTLLLCLVLVVGLTVAEAQATNLLTNPGFESPFEPVAGSSASMVAQGWTAWWSQADPNQAPEFYAASDTTNGMPAPRIHSGSDAQQYFTFFAAHDAGVYQHVTGITAGDPLTFSVYAYLWDSSGSDPNVSDGSGDLALQVGIDPNGGTDPTSSSIVWSSPLGVVDQYAQHSVTTNAVGDSVTVFVRSTVTKVAMNNVVYLDDADLSVGTGAVAVTSTEEATAAVTAEMTQPVTEEVTQALVETIQPIEVTPQVTEAITPEVTEAASPEMTIAVTPELTQPTVTEAVTAEVAATQEVTRGATITPTPTGAVATSTPTEIPPTATPTEAPPTATFTSAPPTETPTEAPPTETFTPAPPTALPSPTPTLNTTVFPYLLQYTVQEGDTVGALAARFGSTVQAIIIANQLNSDALIYRTQTLMIPVQTLQQPSLTPTLAAVPATATETPIVVQPAATTTGLQAQNVAPTLTPTTVVTTYVVRYGDTLSTIAAHFGVTTRNLALYNHILNPNIVWIGEVLHIPNATLPTPTPTPAPSATTIVPTASQQQMLYQVQPGDNLYRISVRFNVSLVSLMEINGIYDANRIFVGQVLIIP